MKTENRATKFFYTIIEMLCTLMLVTLSPGTFLCKLFFLSIESRVHMCVRRIFFVEQLNIGKTEGGGGLIWSKLTLFRHPIILEETVIFFVPNDIYLQNLFLFQLWSYRVQLENFSRCSVTSIYLRRDESETKTKIRENEFHEFFFTTDYYWDNIYWKVTQTML